MFHELQFPFGSGLVVLPALTGGILAMWSQVFVRSVDSADRPPMFLGVLVPATIAGMIAASAGLWNAPLYDETGLPYDTLRNIQIHCTSRLSLPWSQSRPR